MQAHANDLRAEAKNDWARLVDAERTPVPDDNRLDAFVHQVVDDWRGCGLSVPMRRLVEYTEKVTRTPAEMSAASVRELREVGWSERAIHDAVQVIAYFNYVNRVADALGVEAEEGLPHWGTQSD